MSDDPRDPFEELAQRAGAEMRQEPPADGVARLHRARRRRRIVTAAVAGAGAVSIGVAAAMVAGRAGDDGRAPLVEQPTSTLSPPTTSPTTAVPATTSLPATTSVQTSTTLPSTSVVARPPSSDLAVTFVGGGGGAWAPIGWWNGTSWVDPDWPASAPDSPIDSVVALGPGLPDGPLTGLALGDPGEYCVGPELGRYIELGRTLPDEEPALGYRAVAVTATWPLQPRSVLRVGLDAPVYQERGEALVERRAGVDPAAGDVTDVHRADLNGDGIEEVFFVFDHITNTAIGAAGDFSLVVARLPQADGTVDDQVLFAHYGDDRVELPNLGRGGVLGIADLNGDGVMEVLIRSQYWESSVVEAFAWEVGRLERVMSGGCGV